MRSVEEIAVERAQEQSNAVKKILPHERDPGPLNVDPSRYKRQVYYGKCRWCGAKRRAALPYCRVCRRKQKPCEDCGGPIGYRLEGGQCYHCRKIDTQCARKALEEMNHASPATARGQHRRSSSRVRRGS